MDLMTQLVIDSLNAPVDVVNDAVRKCDYCNTPVHLDNDAYEVYCTEGENDQFICCMKCHANRRKMFPDA